MEKQTHKDMKHIALPVAAALLVAACGGRQNEALSKKSSSGKTQEVLLAANQGQYSGAAKALLDSIFKQPQGCLPQPEPRFDVVNIPVSSLKNTQMYQMHRNIVVCEVAPDNPDRVFISRDRWAEPQVVVEVMAKSDTSLQRLLRRHEPQIIDAIIDAEHLRIERAFRNVRNVDLMQRVKDKFGFQMTFSEDFRWATDDDGFAWIRKETKDISLGVLINVTPYKNQEQLSFDKIHNRLDTIMRRHVPSPSADGYMGTERRVDFETRKVDFKGSTYCIETHGLWRLMETTDRMGGPFVSYSMLSPDGRDIIDLIGYVYAPRFNKRDYLMQVEGICNSLKWQ